MRVFPVLLSFLVSIMSGNSLLIKIYDINLSYYYMNLAEVSIYYNNSLISSSSYSFWLSSSSYQVPVGNCFDSNIHTFCGTIFGDNPSLTINIGNLKFDRIHVVNRVDCCHFRIDGASIAVFSDAEIIWKSKFWNAIQYDFYPIG